MKPLNLILLSALFTPLARAQSVEDSVRQMLDENPSAASNDIGPVGIIPILHGPNLSLTTASQHDSIIGWANTLTPDLAWRFSRHLSANVYAPIYLYILTTTSPGTAYARQGASPTTTQSAQQVSRGIPGDTSLAAHLDLQLARRYFYTFTPTLTLPSGDSALGLGTGRTTWDTNHHFEADLPADPYVELGLGDNSSLVNGRIRRGQNSSGLLSHFELGLGTHLPRRTYFAVSAYEILPIGSQIVNSTRNVRRRDANTLTNAGGIAEDNGFNTALDIPLQSHVILSGFYNRSLRQHDDTVGFAFTLLARPTPRPR